VGSVPGKPITRTKEQAKKLAYEILSEARQGANFDSLVAKYTDDRPPGIYKMAATGVSHAVGEYPREQMVPAFGDVGFAISPGNIDIADHDPAKSPYGWHIIKRLR
jgi:parvulin-like peptidyl-prolyl isomerase